MCPRGAQTTTEFKWPVYSELKKPASRSKELKQAIKYEQKAHDEPHSERRS